MLALHVSNRYLDLRPVVAGLAGEAHLQVLEIDRAGDARSSGMASVWLLASANNAFLARAQPFAQARRPDRPTVIWTDSFSNLLGVLR